MSDGLPYTAKTIKTMPSPQDLAIMISAICDRLEKIEARLDVMDDVDCPNCSGVGEVYEEFAGEAHTSHCDECGGSGVKK
jgi:DnaJ-class molecular chaperone